MKIAMITSEAAPYIKSGGLGDVLQALPGELAKLPGNEVALFLPYYKKIKYGSEYEAEFLTSFSVSLTWRQQHVGLFRLKSRKKKLKVYFIDNEYYFCRDGLYGFYDDGERFAYFSKAVLACMNWLDFRPEIMHCHDWQSALVPVYLDAEFRTCFPNTLLMAREKIASGATADVLCEDCLKAASDAMRIRGPPDWCEA